MDIETIKTFIEAGYTKADIDAMQGGDAEGSKSAEEGAEGATDPKQAVMDIKPDNQKGAEVDATIKALSDTVAELSATVKALQTKNAEKADAGRPTDKIKEVMDSFISDL